MVAASVEQDKTPDTSVAFQTLLRVARRIQLEPLNQDAVDSLLRSIFWETPNIQLLAERLYGMSKGNPRAIIQLAQHLVDRGVVTYRSGAWTLPSRLTASVMPESLMEARRVKIKELRSDTLNLAQTLALSTARNFSFKDCARLTEDNTARLTNVLNSLVAAEILNTDGRFYSFTHDAIKGVLEEGLDDATARSAHLKLVKLFQLRDHVDFRAVQHLIGARQYNDALDLLIEHVETALQTVNQRREAQFDYLQSLPEGWSKTIVDAIDLLDRLERPRKQRYLIQYFFVRLSAATGLVNKDDFKSLIEHLYHDCGLDIYHALDDDFNGLSPQQTAQQRLHRTIELAQQRYNDADPLRRGFPPKEALALLPGAVLAAAALASTSLDYLAKYQGQQELYQAALDLIIKRTGSNEGYLFIAANRSLKLAMQIAVQPPPEQTVQTLRDAFTRIVDDDGEAYVSETQTQTATNTDDLPSTATQAEWIDSKFLLTEVNCRRVPVGAVILRHKSPYLERVEQSFIEAIALCLHQRIRQEAQREQQQTESSQAAEDKNRYLIEAMLGEGGMASVYKARDRETGKWIALKRARVRANRTGQTTERTDITAQRTKLENRLRREY